MKNIRFFPFLLSSSAVALLFSCSVYDDQWLEDWKHATSTGGTDGSGGGSDPGTSPGGADPTGGSGGTETGGSGGGTEPEPVCKGEFTGVSEVVLLDDFNFNQVEFQSTSSDYKGKWAGQLSGCEDPLAPYNKETGFWTYARAPICEPDSIGKSMRVQLNDCEGWSSLNSTFTQEVNLSQYDGLIVWGYSEETDHDNGFSFSSPETEKVFLLPGEWRQYKLPFKTDPDKRKSVKSLKLQPSFDGTRNVDFWIDDLSLYKD